MNAGDCLTPAERRWRWAFAAIVLLLTTLPYLLGYAAQAADYRFTGFVFGVEDGNSYIAKMLAGSFGAWKFTSPYTAAPQNGVWFFPLFILLGKLAAPPGLHEQLVALYQLFRLAVGLLMILATYDFIAFFIADVHLRRWGTVLAILGGGLGHLYYFLTRGDPAALPLDFYSPEAFGFLGLYGLPHLALARALMLWALLAYLRAVRAVQTGDAGFQPVRAALRLGWLWLLIGPAQPLTLLVLGALLVWHLGTLALGLWVDRRRRQTADWTGWRTLAGIVVLAGVLPGLFAAYNLWASYFEPYVKLWSAQNLILSPNFIHYLLAYGLLIPFAWRGAQVLLRQGAEAANGRIHLGHRVKPNETGEAFDWAGWLPAAWVLLFPLLAYLPVGIQRRLTDGVWVALVTLAMAAFLSRRMRVRPYFSHFAGWNSIVYFSIFPVVFLSLTTTAGVMFSRQPVYRPADEVRVFEYLQANAHPAEVVLAGFDTSNALPAWAPVRVLTGHGPESVHLAEIQPRVEAFYRPDTPDADRLALLREFGVRYVIFGPPEADSPSGVSWDPDAAAYLSEIYTSGGWRLYHVEALP